MICGVSVARFAFGRYLMNTEADEGFATCASGSLFGSTMCTRATTTPSIFDSVSDSSCDTP
ncbi:type III secretion apparatus lipo, YscJ/HrcJ family domain protein [Burkholderia pseudomallei]|nr:type III secretion apparatus lipo, YscJ/HrcJ family domain protein [Burkholderia pseudomallei]KGC72052.1 type III secretion apparatus lipo, YscJ/HrcJ family domain protein [Burkholderia pseudomallei]KGX48322.1 putative type III secretion domain protein [Burkholderia pseudomallei MSHR3709]